MITATKRRGGCFHFRLTTSCPSKAGTEAADLDASHCAKTGGRSARSSRRTHEKKQKKKKEPKKLAAFFDYGGCQSALALNFPGPFSEIRGAKKG